MKKRDLLRRGVLSLWATAGLILLVSQFTACPQPNNNQGPSNVATNSGTPAQPSAPLPAGQPVAAPVQRSSWLDRRAKIALAFAAVEGLLLLFGRLSSWVVIAVAIPCVAYYLWRGREMRPGKIGRAHV